MSRIGRKPIPIPAGVKIQITPAAIEVQGPKGKMKVPVPRGIRFEQKDGVLNALRDSEEHRALHGLARALVSNAVTGVTTGFKKDLDIVGVGYRAESEGQDSSLQPGLFASGGVSGSGRHSDLGGKADAPGGFRFRSCASWASHREYPFAASARSVQAKGNSHYRRAFEEEGRQSRRQGCGVKRAAA